LNTVYEIDWWWRDAAVTSLGASTKLLYVGPGYYWDGWLTVFGG